MLTNFCPLFVWNSNLAANDGTLTCTTLSIVVTPTVVPGIATYTWTSSTGTISSQATTTLSSTGIYTLSVTDPINGCVTSNTNTANMFTVYQNTTVPTVTLTSLAANDGTLTCTTLSIVITPTVVPSVANYTWTSSTGTISSQATTTLNSVGVYTLSVTDPINGCVTSNTNTANMFTVYQNTTVPTVTLTSLAANDGTLTCTTLSIVVTPTVVPGIATYTWTSSTGTISSQATTTLSSSGVYTLSVTDPVNGCVTSNTNTANMFTVYQNTIVPTVTLTSLAANDGTLTCTTLSIVVTPTVVPSVANYTWTSSTGTISSQATTTLNSAGVYTLSVTDPVNGCVTSNTNTANMFTVYQNTIVPTVTLTSLAANDGTLTCTTLSIVVTPTVVPGIATYTWTSSTGTISSQATATLSSAGVYTLSVTDPVNGCVTSNTNTANLFTVYQNTTVPTVTLTNLAANDGTLTCTTLSIVVTPTVVPGIATYTWTSSTGTISSQATATLSSAGVYTLSVTDPINGCVTSNTNTANLFTVYQNTIVPTMTLTNLAANDGTLTCTTLSIVVTPTVAPVIATYTWTSGAGIISTQATTTLSSAGVYTLSVTDPVNGCVTSNTNTANMFTVYQNTTVPTVSLIPISSNTIIGCGVNSSVTYSANVTTINGNPIYSWNPTGGSTSVFSATVANVYTLVVTNSVTGCSTPTQFTVTGNPTIPDLLTATTVTTPCGSTITALSASSTNTNVSFTWTGPTAAIITGSATSNPTVNLAGNYIVTVTDLLTACTNSNTVLVQQTVVTASFTADQITGMAPLAVNFTNLSTGASTYSWDLGNNSTSTNTNTSTNYIVGGSYTVTLVASQGSCISTATAVIVVEDALTLIIPNVFTPNEDGINDVFSIQSTGVKEIYLSIFNRWGLKLYEFSGPKASWDGIISGSGDKAVDGTYFYMIKVVGFDDKVIEKQGTVNLFR